MDEQHPPDSHLKDVWASGAAYEPYVGRWSRLVALQFLAWLAVPPGKTWLELGSGSGALTRSILEVAAPHSVQGFDSAAGFIDYARKMITDERVSFELGDAQALPVGSGVYDAVVSGLVLNFVPHPEQMLAEMARAAKPGGLVAVYVWDYAGTMQFLQHFWSAAADLDPAAADLDEARRFPLCNPDPLTALFQSASLKNIQVRSIEILTLFKDFDDYWSPFLGGQGPAPTYAMSLSEQQRIQLRERIRAALPITPDGSIPLVARAWAVRATR
jgi:SAM-dependent methyltransferase